MSVHLDKFPRKTLTVNSQTIDLHQVVEPGGGFLLLTKEEVSLTSLDQAHLVGVSEVEQGSGLSILLPGDF